MSIIPSYNQSMSLLNMVLSGKNNNGNISSLADFHQQKASTGVSQLAQTMSSFQATGPGSVELTSYPSLGYNNGTMSKLPKYNESTVQHDYLTKTEAKMSEKEFEAAIKKLAEKNAAAGVTTNVGDDYYDLAQSYISTVSPDRKGIIAGASPTLLVPSKINYDMANAYDDDGNVVATYNPTKGWTNKFTETEKARNKQFDEIYWNAYNAYAKTNNPETPENAIVGNDTDKPTTIDVSA